MASGTIRQENLGYYRKGDTISFANMGLVGNNSNNILTCDVMVGKQIPGTLGISGSDFAVSAVRGNGQTESAVTVTYRACSKGTNHIRIQFDVSGASNQTIYVVYLSAGTITFT